MISDIKKEREKYRTTRWGLDYLTPLASGMSLITPSSTKYSDKISPKSAAFSFICTVDRLYA